MKIALIGCVKLKNNYKCKARDMYISPLFIKSLAYVEKKIKPDKIYILSAKYELLPENKVIEPYEKTLNKMKSAERKIWANNVIEQLKKESNLEKDTFYVLAGSKYIENIKPHIKNCIDAMHGLSQGRRLQFLNNELC